MEKQVVLTKNSPEPIGPYSQAVRVGSLLFCSGQIALDPSSGQMDQKGQDDVTNQTHRVMKNIEGLLKEVGVGFENIVKATIFLKSMEDFPKVNSVYATYFKKDPPARSTVEVSRLPKDALVEIEVIACL